MQRVPRTVVFADLEMQIRPGDPATLPHCGHPRPASDPLPFLDLINGIVGIEGEITARMADDHHLAIAPEHITEDDLPVGGCEDRRPLGRGDIDPVVESPVAWAKA